jgi:hypothetical protein
MTYIHIAVDFQNPTDEDFDQLCHGVCRISIMVRTPERAWRLSVVEGITDRYPIEPVLRPTGKVG